MQPLNRSLPALVAAEKAHVPADVWAQVAEHLGPLELLRCGTLGRELRDVVAAAGPWRRHLAGLPPPRPAPDAAAPRAAWLAAQRLHRWGASELPPLARPECTLLAAALADGAAVVSWSDGSLEVSAVGAAPPRQLVGHPRPLTLLAADEDAIVGGAPTVPAHVWSQRTGALLVVLDDGAAGIVGLALRGDVAVTGSTDGVARVWSAQNGALRFCLDGHGRPPACLALDDGHVATSCGARRARLWSLADGSVAHELVGGHRVVQLAMGGGLVAAAADDGFTARAWSTATGVPVGEPHDMQFDPVTALTTAPGRALVGTARGWVDAWDDAQPRPHATPPLAVSLSVAGIAVRGDTLVIAYADGTVALASLAQRRTRQLLLPTADRPRGGEATTLCLRGDLLAVGAADGLMLWRFDQEPGARRAATRVGAALGAAWGLWGSLLGDFMTLGEQ